MQESCIMKKRFLVAAITAAMVSPVAAYAEADVYGKAHASYTFNSGDDSTDNVTIASNASRLGVKGSEDIGGGMKAFYKMEFEVNIADGGAFKGRNQYVGLSGSMGQFRIGRHDTPLKMVQGKFDQFNDTIADMGKDKMVDGEDRLDNVLALISPKMGGMQAMIALVPGEQDGTNPANDLTGAADGISAAFTYDAKNLFVSLGNNSGDLVDDQTRLVATFKMDDMQFGGLYSTTDFGMNDDQVSMGLSFGMKVSDAGKVKLQFIDAADIGGAAGVDETRMDVGYDHKMSKRTSVYALVDSFSEADRSAVSFGIVHNF